MPSELRQLIFSPDEVVAALKDFHRRVGRGLPAGTVRSCEPIGNSPGEQISFCVEMADDAQGSSAKAPQTFKFEAPELAAALILFCRDRRIPLPAIADKSVQRFGDQVCLVATLSRGSPPPLTRANTRSSALR